MLHESRDYLVLTIEQRENAKPDRAMGWDAYAVGPKIDPRVSTGALLDSESKELFRRASLDLARLTGRGSDNLATGTLGGLSIGILARATGVADYDETSEDGGLLWPPEIVARAREQADWSFHQEDDDGSFSVTEARLFLDVCASHGLGIWFSW